VKSSVHARTIMNQNHVINTDQAEKMAIGIFVLEQTTLGKKSNFYNYLNVSIKATLWANVVCNYR